MSLVLLTSDGVFKMTAEAADGFVSAGDSLRFKFGKKKDYSEKQLELFVYEHAGFVARKGSI